MKKKSTYRFKCVKSKCWIEYDVHLYKLEAQPCPKCKDFEYVELLKEIDKTVDLRKLDDYGYSY